MSVAPHSRFSPGELSDLRGPVPSTAELAEAVAVGRAFERLGAIPDVRPSDGFVSAVMAAIASEPLPAPGVALRQAVLAKRAGEVLRALADVWRIAWTGGRPLSVRLQGLAFVLVVATLVAAVGGTVLVGAASWLSQLAPPSTPHITEPAVAPAPSPSATPNGATEARPTATPARLPSQSPSTATVTPSLSPSPERSVSPGSTDTPHPTATPEETDEPDAGTPQPSDTPDDSGSDIGGSEAGGG